MKDNNSLLKNKFKCFLKILILKKNKAEGFGYLTDSEKNNIRLLENEINFQDCIYSINQNTKLNYNTDDNDLVLLAELYLKNENRPLYQEILNEKEQLRNELRKMKVVGDDLLDIQKKWIYDKAITQDQEFDKIEPIKLEKFQKNIIERNKKAIKTGWFHFDHLMGGGIYLNSLVGVLARTSQGKSTFMLQLILNMCSLWDKEWKHINGKKTSTWVKRAFTPPKAVWFALEESKELIRNKIIAQKLWIKLSHLRNNFADETWDDQGELKKYEEQYQYIENNIDFLFADRCPRDIESISNIIKTAYQKDQTKIFVIDHMFLLKSIHNHNNFHTLYTQIINELLHLSQSLDIVIFITLQASRAFKSKNGESQDLTSSDIRESGRIEENLNILIGLMTEEKEDLFGNIAYNTKIKVLKNREGRTGHIDLAFNKEYASFNSPHEEKKSKKGKQWKEKI